MQNNGQRQQDTYVNKDLTEKQKTEIERAVAKAVKEYGVTLRLLGGE